MELSYLHIITISALIEFIFLGFIISIRKKGYRVSNRLFSFILISLSVMVFATLLYSLDYFYQYNRIINMLHQFYFLPPPLLYLYVRSLYIPERKISLKSYLNFVPFFIMFVLSFFVYDVLSAYPGKPFFILISAVSAFFLLNIYYFFIIRIYKQLKYEHLKNKKTIKSYRKLWVNIFLSGCYIIVLVKVLLVIYLNLTNLFILEFYKYNHIWYPARYIYFISSFVFFYIVVYITINKTDIILPKIKYKNSNLSINDRKIFIEELNKLLKEQRLYLDPELSLTNLAGKLAISRINLSQIINQEYKQNFNDYINSFRIEHCKELLQESENNKKTIIEILFESGFNSKPTFNNAFKKHTGMTPKQYRKLVSS